MARETARRQGAHEAILISGLGITECASSNVFAASKGKFITAPEGSKILSGITRKIVIELAHKAGVPVELTYLKEELFSVDEVFITNTVDEILPVVNINGKIISKGAPGKITNKFEHMFQQAILSCI